jgi:hypothetical protein
MFSLDSADLAVAVEDGSWAVSLLRVLVTTGSTRLLPMFNGPFRVHGISLACVGGQAVIILLYNIIYIILFYIIIIYIYKIMYDMISFDIMYNHKYI